MATKKLTGCIVAGLIAGTSLADAPPEGSVTIDDFSYSGNGCPQGSVSSNLSDDAKALTLLFDDYIAEKFGPAPDKKECDINLKLRAPDGWSYSLFCVDMRGFADLDEGARGVAKTKYSFSNQSQERHLGTLQLYGPFSDDYSHFTALTPEQIDWSVCGQTAANLKIKTKVKVDNGPTTNTERIHLVSSRGRYKEKVLSHPIESVTLIERTSRSSCQEGRSYGFQDNKLWVNRGCGARFDVKTTGHNAATDAGGTMTADSVDQVVQHHYGVAWRRCGSGRWIQADGQRSCEDTCSRAGLRSTTDPHGASCASGEARPSSAFGFVEFSNGCWGSCTPQGNIATQSHGRYCYQPGQRRDSDRTDRTIGCYCK